MAELKTKENNASANEFSNSIKDVVKREDCFAVAKMMAKETNARTKMCGEQVSLVLEAIIINIKPAMKGICALLVFTPEKKYIIISVRSFG